jgi:V-type H+-transporting ATPase subunit A
VLSLLALLISFLVAIPFLPPRRRRSVLGPYFDSKDAEFSYLRNTARDVLQQEKDLSEIVQLVGRDSLSEDQKVRRWCRNPHRSLSVRDDGHEITAVTPLLALLSRAPQVVLEVAKIIREDYLQQNAFSEHDYNCPLTKSIGMLRAIVTLYTRCLKAVTGSDVVGKTAAAAEGAKTVTWNVIKASAGKVIYRVTDMKFLDPRTPDADMAKYFGAIIDDINAAFDELAE